MSNRILYQAQSLFVGNSPATGTLTGTYGQPGSVTNDTLHQLYRVTSVNHSFTVTRQDINQFGQLAAIDRIILQAPVVNLDFSYHVANVGNESALGFNVAGTNTAVQYFLDTTQDSKNYYIRVVPEGNDVVGYTGIDGGVFGIGNGYITSYSSQGAVGAIPSASIRVEANNIKYDTFTSGVGSPAVNPADGSLVQGSYYVPIATSGAAGQTVSALQPGQIQLNLNGAGIGLSGVCLQSYNLSIDLRREPLQCLGQKFPYVRLMTFPVTATLDVEAIRQNLGSGSLSNLICNDPAYNLNVSLYAPACTGLGQLQVSLGLSGAKLESQNETASIGPSERVTMKFTAQLGGPQQSGIGFFLGGSLT